MKRFVEWTFEGGPKSFISRVGADGNRTRYQSGVYDSTCERGPRVNLSGTAIIRTLLPSQEQQLRCPEAVFFDTRVLIARVQSTEQHVSLYIH